MAEPSYKEMPSARTAFAEVSDDRYGRPYSRDHQPDDETRVDLALDDTGIELDESDEPTRIDRRAASTRPRASGVVPRNRDSGALRVGEVVAGKYRIEQVLEETDTCAIVRAVHLGLEQVVTLKYLLPAASTRSDGVSRFLRAARTASQLQSEHVARIIDVGRTRSGVPFVVTEELSGWELDEVLRVRGPLPVQEAVEYAIQASEAVAEGHALGIVHGALNLANLVLTRRPDDSPLVKVLGFGASALPERRLLGEGGASLLGSSGFTSVLPYLAPEQIRMSDTVDERADVWALGALLHTLLTGSPPFRGKTAVELLAVVSADPPRRLLDVRDDVSPDLEACVLRCLEKDRSARFGNLAEFVVALKPFASGDAHASIERISRMFGRGTRPPPLPGRHPSSIVPVARPPAAAPTTPTPASTQAPPSRWFLFAAAAGAGAGALGAVLVGLSIRSELSALARATTPVAVVAAPAVPPPQLPSPIAAVTPPAPVPAAAQAPRTPVAAVSPLPRPVAPQPAPLAPARPVAPEAAPHATNPVVAPPAVTAKLGTSEHPPAVRGGEGSNASRAIAQAPRGPTLQKSGSTASPADLFDDTK